MIKFKISILLAFSLLPKSSVGPTGKGKKGKGGAAAKKKSAKSKSDKSSKSSKRSGKKEKQEKPVVEKPKYLFEVGAPVGFSHIEYELIPGRLKYQVDVVCWGPIAKYFVWKTKSRFILEFQQVFSADGEITLTTFVKNQLAWVPLSITHVLNQMNQIELLKLHSHVVNYTIWTSKNKLGARAKSDNTKAFFIREEDIDSEAKFTEAYNANPNLEKCEDKRITDLQKEIKNILWECADKPGEKNYEEIVTRLEFLSDSVHKFHANKIIDRVIIGKTVECKDFVPICPPPLTDEDLIKPAAVNKSKKKGKKGKEDKKAKGPSKPRKEKAKKPAKGKKGEGLLKISVPGEVFFTDPCLNIYDLRDASAEIAHGFVLTTTNNLLSRLQRYLLNPLIIKIKKISGLPVELLRSHRFTSVYAHYSVPYVARCSTIQKPLGKVVKFNEAHAHFTTTVPKRKLLEFMQTQRLQIEIRGVREECPAPLDPNLFGSEEGDPTISAKLSARDCIRISGENNEPSTVTLAVACYDISSLLCPTWDFKEKASSHHPDTLSFQKVDTMYENYDLIDTLNINEINLRVLSKPKSWSPFTESLLLDCGTTLKAEVYVSAPISTFLDVQDNPILYFQRMFAVVKCKNTAMVLLNVILGHNQTVLGPEISIANFLKGSLKAVSQTEMLRRGLKTPDDIPAYTYAVTGFLIDNGTSYAFFIEGVADSFVEHVWQQIQYSDQGIMKIFYNSDFYFEQRLYSDFLHYGGIYPINLKVPLEQIMSQEGVYLEGNVPLPGWEALKKLDILLKCTTLRAMTQYCMFPTAKQLLSMAFEWGVPFKWSRGEDGFKKEPSEPQLQSSENQTKHNTIVTELYLSSCFSLPDQV